MADAKPPRHVALIMDGNGRWAKARRRPRASGHKAGVERVREVVEAAPELGIEVLTLYAFSSENWKRPDEEVGFLFGLLRQYIESELQTFIDNGVRLRVIGEWEQLPRDVVPMIEDAIARTATGDRLTVVIALNYGSRDEIARAAQRLAERVAKGEMTAGAIDEAAIAAELDTAGLPDPDLLVRTSGEQRLSNFLLWQASYAELVFTDRLWPDFGRAALEAACAEFSRRERRYGGL